MQFLVLKILCTPIGGQVILTKKKAFPRDFLTKLDTYQDHSKTLGSAAKKMKNDIRSGK